MTNRIADAQVMFDDYLSVSEKISENLKVSKCDYVEVEWADSVSITVAGVEGEATYSLDQIIAELEISDTALENYAVIDLFLSNNLNLVMPEEIVNEYSLWKFDENGWSAYKYDTPLMTVPAEEVVKVFAGLDASMWTFEACYKSLNDI